MISDGGVKQALCEEEWVHGEHMLLFAQQHKLETANHVSDFKLVGNDEVIQIRAFFEGRFLSLSYMRDDGLL